MSNQVKHGGQVYQFARTQSMPLPDSLQSVLDFSASINPIQPEIDWQQLSQAAQITVPHYPDQQQVTLKQAIGETFQLEANQITLTNGISSAIMSLFAQLKPDISLLFTPIYSEYQRAASLHSQQVIEVPQNELQTDSLDSVFSKLTEKSVMVLVNPNTPQGLYQSLECLEPLIRAAIAHNCWLFIDESFLPFISLANKASVRCLLRQPVAKKWIVLQSLTKYYACPGVRIGALFSAPNALNELGELSESEHWQWPSWPISVLDEQFLLQALKDENLSLKTADFLNKERPLFIEKLSECDLIQSVESGLANFLLVKTTLPVSVLQQALQDHHILIRDCQSFGLSEHDCRIAIKTHEQNQQLIIALEKVSNKQKQNSE